ncbi:MAG: hypothetical protein HWE21_10200, partial [Cytophagia bacterium]|nr:hypothetical protein [Cytophagia bacterium]
ALPVLGALVFALACTEEVSPESNEIVFEETEIPVDSDAQVSKVTKVYTYFNIDLDSIKRLSKGEGRIVTGFALPLVYKNASDTEYELRLPEAKNITIGVERQEFHFKEREIEVPNSIALEEDEVQTVFIVKPDKSKN